MAMRVGYQFREATHSSRSGQADRQIMSAVVERLELAGAECRQIDSAHIRAGGTDLDTLDVILSMARSVENLGLLAALDSHVRVINCPRATLDTLRNRLYRRLESARAPMPVTREIPIDSDDAASMPFLYWLKRIDYHHVLRDDVVRIADPDSLSRARDHFLRQGHATVYQQAHADGRDAKVYGVYDPATRELPFLSVREAVPAAVVQQMRTILQRVLEQVPLAVFGADFVIGADGLWIVDLNAWPTFRSCQAAAADAIAGQVLRSSQPVL